LVGRGLVCVVILALGLVATTDLAGIDVAAVASAIGIVHVRESLLHGHVRRDDLVTDQVVGEDIELRFKYPGLSEKMPEIRLLFAFPQATGLSSRKANPEHDSV
jgi:hypothetical protein